MYIYDNISLNSALNDKFFRKKLLEKISTYMYLMSIFFPENHALMR